MTIKYLDSKRISALSTDKWISSGTKVTSSSGTVTATIDASSLDQYATYDLGSTLSATWVLRYKQQATTNNLVLASGNAGALYVGLSDITNISTDTNGSGASTLYQRLRHESGNWYVDGFDIRSRDGSATTAGGNSGAGALSTGAQTYYVEIVKNGSSSTVKYFSNSDYSTGQVGSTQTVNATGSGSSLRYLGVHVLSESRASGSLVVECSDFKIYDGVTSASGTPTFSNLPDGHPINVQDNSILVEKDTGKRYWAGSTVKIDTDFSSNTGWTNGGGGFVAISSGSLAYNCGNASPATSDSRSYYDLGTNVSESKWVLRFKMTSTVVSNSASSCHLGFGLSSITSAWDVNGSALVFVRGAGTNSNDNQYYLSRATLGGFVDNGNANKAGFSTSTGNVTNQVYYVELKRTSATTVVATIFSDEYVTTVESETFTNLSGVTGLRYLKCASRSQNTNTNSGTIDDVIFYNGVSSV